MRDLTELTLSAAADGLGRGDFSAQELCAALLQRCATVEDRVHAFLHLDAERILTDAAAADARRRQGVARSRLDGIPVAVKDNLAVDGQPCGCASKMLDGYVAPFDATVIATLRAAGVVFFGRTNMDEFAMGSSTENSGMGPTANPWRLDHVPGGSSGGSAAAVAAREALAALGSDTGGSIRQPAAFCGVVGLKPSYGRVSRYGLVAFASSLDQIGPITRDVRDAALLFDLIAGHDPRDSTSLPDAPVPCEPTLAALDARRLRVGLPREYLDVEGLDDAVRDTVLAAAERFRSLGADVVDVSLPLTNRGIAAYYIIAPAEASANLARFDGVRYGFRDRAGEAENLIEMYRRSRANGFGQEVKRRIILGTYVLSSGYYDAYYLRAQKVRTLIRQDYARAFERCDVILAPCAPTAAFRRGAMSSPLEMYLADVYTIPANLAGICGLTVPAGFTGDGLPVGVQLLGPALGEQRVLQAGWAFERECPENLRRRPDL